jgi:hypothetical protein
LRSTPCPTVVLPATADSYRSFAKVNLFASPCATVLNVSGGRELFSAIRRATGATASKLKGVQRGGYEPRTAAMASLFTSAPFAARQSIGSWRAFPTWLLSRWARSPTLHSRRRSTPYMRGTGTVGSSFLPTCLSNIWIEVDIYGGHRQCWPSARS